MSYEFPTSYTKLYRRNVQHLAQQKKSRLRMTTEEIEIASDEEAFSDFLGAVKASEITTRHGDTIISSTPHTRRKIFTKPYYWSDMIDSMDKARTIHHLDGKYAEAGAMALKRSIDEVIMKAIFGIAFAGKEGQEQISFPAEQVVPVNYVQDGAQVDSGITVDKIRRAVEMLQLADIESDEKKYLIWTPIQISQLLKETKVISTDFNARHPLVEGEINQFLGVSFITYNKIPKDANGYRRCAVITEKAITLAIKREIDASIDTLIDKHRSTLVYVRADFGAARMHEKRVVEIKCKE